MNQHNQQAVPQMYSLVDPYVYQALHSMIGCELVIETTRGNIRGKVADVKPDHVVLLTGNTSFFVRIQEIIWFMP